MCSKWCGIICYKYHNTYPTKLGNVPATGSIIAAILKTHNAKVINLGKPSKSIFSIFRTLGTNKKDILCLVIT